MSNEKEISKKVEANALVGESFSRLIALGVIILAIFFIVRYFYGNDTIGDWFEKPREYTTQYWVYLEPYQQSTKNYRVTGDIEKVSRGDDGGWIYLLRTVYWNNGGHSNFDDCEISIKGSDYCIDYAGKGYTVRLGEKKYNK